MKKSILIIAALLWIALAACGATAEEVQDEELYVGFDLNCYWVLCQPDSFVNCRRRPSGRSESIGRFECGEMVVSDGERRRGFLHVVNLSFELTDGWIHEGYVTECESRAIYKEGTINSKYRVAARRTIGGEIRKWMRNGSKIRVYWASREWAVTNQGFVKSEYIGGIDFGDERVPEAGAENEQG